MSIPTAPFRIPTALPRITLLMVCGFNVLSAVAGGIGLLAPGSLGMPVSLIAGSPFTSYLWPGIILLTVVGGTHLAAFVALWRRSPLGLFWQTVAGFALLIWIYVEVAFMDTVFIHTLYFATAAIELALVIALLDVVPGFIRPVRERR